MPAAAFAKPGLSAAAVRGFTLIELLIVFVILGLLAGVIAPRFLQRQAHSTVQSALAQIELIEKALDQYRFDNRHYPSSAQGLAALLQRPANEPRWHGPYLKRTLPTDPWGRAWDYQAPGGAGREYRISSLGADGLAGGDGENADLASR